MRWRHLGFRCSGRFLALNSYENRVYKVALEGAADVVVKFYRPGRWSDHAILEEHDFARQLAERGDPGCRAARDRRRYFVPVGAISVGGLRKPRRPSARTRRYEPPPAARTLRRTYPPGRRRLSSLLRARCSTLSPSAANPATFSSSPISFPANCKTSMQESPRQYSTWQPLRSIARVVSASCDCMATCIPATSWWPVTFFTSSTSTMPAPDLPFRTCGCSCPGTARK